MGQKFQKHNSTIENLLVKPDEHTTLFELFYERERIFSRGGDRKFYRKEILKVTTMQVKEEKEFVNISEKMTIDEFFDYQAFNSVELTRGINIFWNVMIKLQCNLSLPPPHIYLPFFHLDECFAVLDPFYFPLLSTEIFLCF